MSVRVRFAPSPTGWLHVGGARTAYFNWLFARKHGGQFIVRVEDTDADRSSDASERGVLEDLRWLDLGWDEGPDVGGPHGPYRQSERLALYRERAQTLLARGAAYRCFCSEAELDERRRAAHAAGQPPHYDGRCGRLDPAIAAARAEAGEPYSVRFRVPARDVALDDAVRGHVVFPAGVVGDFVVLRPSGLPTYNFACVVDDADMRISHVLRAEEHLANTPRQLMLYEAFGLVPPVFAHLALILNADRTKMSKRSGEAAVAVGDWRRAGFVPDALLSYLALLGFHPGDDREILSRAELLEAFTLDRIGRSGSIFDAAKLRWTNASVLHHASGTQLAAWGAAPGPDGRPFLPAAALALPEAARARLLEVMRGTVETLAELDRELAAVLGDRVTFEADARAALVAPEAAQVCRALAEAWDALADWNAAMLKSALAATGASLGVKGKALFQPVRAALTGRIHGPELPAVAECIGRDRCLARLRAAADGSTE